MLARRASYLIYRGWAKAPICLPHNRTDGPFTDPEVAEMHFRWRVAERREEIEAGLTRVAMVAR